MSILGTVVLWSLAFVGALSILGSVGVWVFASRLEDAPVSPPASEVVARFTNNVRVGSASVDRDAS